MACGGITTIIDQWHFNVGVPAQQFLIHQPAICTLKPSYLVTLYSHSLQPSWRSPYPLVSTILKNWYFKGFRYRQCTLTIPTSSRTGTVMLLGAWCDCLANEKWTYHIGRGLRTGLCALMWKSKYFEVVFLHKVQKNSVNILRWCRN